MIGQRHYHRTLFLGLLLLAGNSGCNSVQKRLIVRTNPPGAIVNVDHQFVGHSPVSVPFTYHGTRQIKLEKDGFKTVQVDERIPPRWFEKVPFSFVADNFWPREIRDERVLDFELEPKEQVSENRLRDRATELRQNVQQGTVTVPINR